MIYNNINTGFILRYNGVHQTPIPGYLDSFIITVLCKDIFDARIAKIGFTAYPKSEIIYNHYPDIFNEIHKILPTYSGST